MRFKAQDDDKKKGDSAHDEAENAAADLSKTRRDDSKDDINNKSIRDSMKDRIERARVTHSVTDEVLIRKPIEVVTNGGVDFWCNCMLYAEHMGPPVCTVSYYASGLGYTPSDRKRSDKGTPKARQKQECESKFANLSMVYCSLLIVRE